MLDLRQPHRCCPPTTLVISSNLAENEKHEHFFNIFSFFIKKSNDDLVGGDVRDSSSKMI